MTMIYTAMMSLINGMLDRYADGENGEMLMFCDLDECLEFVNNFNDCLDRFMNYDNFGGGKMIIDNRATNAFVVLWFFEEDAVKEVTKSFELYY